MDNSFKWLVLGELIIFAIIIAIKLIIRKLENKKVDNILAYIEKKSKDKQVDKAFKDCIKIIEQQNKNIDN